MNRPGYHVTRCEFSILVEPADESGVRCYREGWPPAPLTASEIRKGGAPFFTQRGGMKLPQIPYQSVLGTRTICQSDSIACGNRRIRRTLEHLPDSTSPRARYKVPVHIVRHEILSSLHRHTHHQQAVNRLRKCARATECSCVQPTTFSIVRSKQSLFLYPSYLCYARHGLDCDRPSRAIESCPPASRSNDTPQ